MSIAALRRDLKTPLVVADKGPPFALRCAGNVYATVDRRMHEAAALASWLEQYAETFGIEDSELSDDLGPRSRRQRGFPAPDWRRIGMTLLTSSALLHVEPASSADLWLGAVSRNLALDTIEAGILSLALHYRLDPRFERLLDMLSSARGGRPHFHRDPVLIGMLLAADVAAVADRLQATASLLRSGLMHAATDGDLCVLNRLLVLVRAAVPPADDFHDQLLGKTKLDSLPWESFSHLGREAELVARLLRAALECRQGGINILLYGPPGTGKTSFATTLAARVGARLRSVGEADENGGEPVREQRLSSLRLAQRLLVPGETLLLFDEAEDLFVPRSLGFGRMAAGSRVFVHRLLEEVAAPVIWTANDISSLGPGVLRRMTMCVQLRVPDVAARAHLWRKIGQAEGVTLPDADPARLARLVPAAPAVAATALRATKMMGGDAETALMLVEGVARAVQGGRLAAPAPELDARYDLALVNADCDLASLTEWLGRPDAPRAVSFLLSGPSGSGKSAWVRHLAQRMGLPVLQKRSSDLLNLFVGGTEHRIADAFAEAREIGAFLVFDEADSLLLDRADAVRSWEISQVNEMLTWMESHPLPFACTTNLADRLDRASLRRFLVKVRFDWLTVEQARQAFRRFFGADAPAALDALGTLTPADFALVRRRMAVAERSSLEDLVRLLASEVYGRVGGRRPVGFAATATG
jgi:SpoVK/Ycf46/Vps4 family AAA+-type ATPase